jgi:hypothetical protein
VQWRDSGKKQVPVVGWVAHKAENKVVRQGCCRLRKHIEVWYEETATKTCRLIASPYLHASTNLLPASRLGGQIFCRRGIRPVVSNEPEPS